MTLYTGRTLSLPGFVFALGVLLGGPATSVAQNPPLPPSSQAQQALQQAALQNPGLADSIRRRLEASGLTPSRFEPGSPLPGTRPAYSTPTSAQPRQDKLGLSQDSWS